MTLTREKTLSEPASKARLRLWLRLLRVTREVEGELREKLRRDHATTLPRFDVMAALSRNPEGLKMSELSGVLRVSNGNVTGIIERLVEEGHVLRAVVDGDRRAFSVRLTEAGRAEFARQAAEHEAWIDAALSAISPEDAGEITRRLGALTKREG
ncbi:MAG: MarR family transcriptional regulator [Rhodobacteraceae bacterium]|nr:MAG: MarR family transcriptional regulator [Paracoccaceae bacterium]